MTAQLKLNTTAGGSVTLLPDDTASNLVISPQTGYYLPAGTGAVATTVQTKLRESASVKDFGAVGDGVTDGVPALVSALNSGASVVTFPPTSQNYTFSSNATITLTRDTIIDFEGQLITSTASKITLKGTTVASGRTLAANALRYATSITLNSGTDIQRGDLIHIYTTIAPASAWSDTKQDLVRASSISGAVVALDAPLNFPYATGDAGLSITIYRPVKVTLRNIDLTLIAADADTTSYSPFWLEGLADIIIENPVIRGQLPFSRTTNIYRTGLTIYRCYGYRIGNPDYEALSYPMGVYGGSRAGFETGVTARYCHHAHADLGNWSSDYTLDGLVSDDGYQSINTHPCFRVHATRFEVRSDYGLINWRVCGGSLTRGRVRSTVDDTAELPQFQNITPNIGFSYINDDADFVADDVVFDCPGRSAKAAFAVRYGRVARYSNLRGECWAGLSSSELALWICNTGNQFGANLLPSLPDSLVLSTAKRIDVPFDGVETIASVSTITPKIGTGTVYLTGTTSVLNITASGFEGKTITLITQDSLAVGDGGNLRLASTYSMTPDDTLTLKCRSSVWYEIGRSVN